MIVTVRFETSKSWRSKNWSYIGKLKSLESHGIVLTLTSRTAEKIVGTLILTNGSQMDHGNQELSK